MWEQLGSMASDGQRGGKHFLRASGHGERICQGVKETGLGVAAARGSLVAAYLPSCGCSNLLKTGYKSLDLLTDSGSVAT